VTSPTVIIAATIVFGPGAPSEVAMRLSVADDPGLVLLDEHLRLEGAGDSEVETWVEPDGGRVGFVKTDGSRGQLRYRARVQVRADGGPAPISTAERLRWTSPSRYCPSDTLFGFAQSVFGDIHPMAAIDAIPQWVRGHVRYQVGASQVTTTAVETLLHATGVCRDYAHLAICLLRAVGVPARYVAVYAPGLHPQDFHALVEAYDGTRWVRLDPSGMSDPALSVRIATGADGAETPFLATLSGFTPVEQVLVDARLTDPA
jgi:transglutaminase-like putative cysteine protease